MRLTACWILIIAGLTLMAMEAFNPHARPVVFCGAFAVAFLAWICRGEPNPRPVPQAAEEKVETWDWPKRRAA